MNINKKKTVPKATVSVPNIESEKKISELESRLARALADYQNLENRFSRESSAVVKFATAGLLQKLLMTRDHLEMASESLKDQSLSMILSSLDKVLIDEGVKEIDASGAFNPNLMECQEEVAGAKNQVMRVLQKGYLLHDRILRPARVVVGNGNIETKSSEAINNTKEESK